MSSRTQRSELFMGIAKLYAERSTCKRGHVGAVAVREGRVVAAGYNGAPSGQRHCLEIGCELVNEHCVRAVHAEANLVAWAARTGTPLLGTGVWSTTRPCLACTKLLANAGVVGVVFLEDYVEETPILYDQFLEVRRYIEPRS